MENCGRFGITGCNLIDGNLHTGIVRGVTILVEDGKILRIGPKGEVEIPGGFAVVDAGAKYAVPGLINAHAHLFGGGRPMKAIGGGGAQRRLIKLAGTRPGLRVLDGLVRRHAAEELFSGVTTVRAVGDFFYSDVRARDGIDSGKLPGPRLLVSGPAITVTGGHGYGSFALTCDCPWEGRKLVRKNACEQVDLIKICVTGGVSDSRKPGDAVRLKMTEDEVAAVCDEAHRLGLMVAAHAESREGVLTALKGGVDTVEHGSALDGELMALFKSNERSLRGWSALIPTFSPVVPIYALPPSVTKLGEAARQNDRLVLDGMSEGTRQACANGIRVGFGTDASCPFVTQYGTWRELEYAVKLAGITPEQAIHSATAVNAEILGIAGETGTIEEGKAADILLLDANPLENLRAFSQPFAVVSRGRLLERPKLKKFAEIDRILDEINLESIYKMVPERIKMG